jgi:hypothetical protein
MMYSFFFKCGPYFVVIIKLQNSKAYKYSIILYTMFNKDIKQVKKNVSMSFGYVKKDLLMLNDSIAEMNDKIQHLSLNHAALLDRIETLKEMIGKGVKKGSNEKSEIEFYDAKTKKKFKSNKYSIRTKSGKRFAVATSPSGSASWRILSNKK